MKRAPGVEGDMRRLAWLPLLVLPIAFAFVAGCVSCVEGPPVTARGITTGDASAGMRGFDLNLLVTDGPGGAPLEGAGVVVYYGGSEVGQWSEPRIEVGPDERIVVEPVNVTTTPESREVLRMRTGADGFAHAHVPGNRIVGIVAAKEGFTEEWLPAVAAGDTGTEGALIMPLYRQSIVVDVDSVWGPGAASTGAATSSQYGWDPQPAPFAASPDANRGYAARIAEMRITIEWTNGATSAGDLGVGIGPPDDNPTFFQDGGNNVGMGAQRESAVLSLQQLRDHGILGAPEIDVGAATKTGFVAPFGMPWTAHVEALFDTARAAYATCSRDPSQNDSDGLGASVPGQGALGAMLALTGAAFALSVRRPRA